MMTTILKNTGTDEFEVQTIVDFISTLPGMIDNSGKVQSNRLNKIAKFKDYRVDEALEMTRTQSGVDAVLGDSSDYEFKYETHGDKHFNGNTNSRSGGGSQFKTKDSQNTVNPVLVECIKSNWEKIESLLKAGEDKINVYIGGDDNRAKGYRWAGDDTNHFVIQVTVDLKNKKVDFHGYPMDPTGKNGVGRSLASIS